MKDFGFFFPGKSKEKSRYNIYDMYNVYVMNMKIYIY